MLTLQAIFCIVAIMFEGKRRKRSPDCRAVRLDLEPDMHKLLRQKAADLEIGMSALAYRLIHAYLKNKNLQDFISKYEI